MIGNAVNENKEEAHLNKGWHTKGKPVNTRGSEANELLINTLCKPRFFFFFASPFAFVFIPAVYIALNANTNNA